jgi:hypothetical protein
MSAWHDAEKPGRRPGFVRQFHVWQHSAAVNPTARNNAMRQAGQPSSQLSCQDTGLRASKWRRLHLPRYPTRRSDDCVPRHYLSLAGPLAGRSRTKGRQCRPSSPAALRARSQMARNAWPAPRNHAHLNAAGGLLMTTSTRRFCCRPDAESLSATGSLRPLPDAVSRVAPIPCAVRYDFTDSARRSESAWL